MKNKYYQLLFFLLLANFIHGQQIFKKGNAHFQAMNFGIGGLYELKNKAVIRAEVGIKFFPDVKIGLGWRF